MSLLSRWRRRLAPDLTRRALAVSVAKDFAREPSSLFQRLHPTNLKNHRALRDLTISCNVCGLRSRTFYDFPNLRRRLEHGIGILRETVSCLACGATMRHRILAAGLLDEIGRLTQARFASIEAYRRSGQSVDIFDSDSYSPIHDRLIGRKGYTCSSYFPDVDFGSELSPGRFNVDLQAISFADSAFDIVLTSDVMEHVEHDDRAHAEIHRVLRPGGAYVFTVPYDPTLVQGRQLAATTDGGPVFFEHPHYHGDSITAGVLAYRIYGRDLIGRLEGLGFSVDFRPVSDAERGIVNGDCFVAIKRDAGSPPSGPKS